VEPVPARHYANTSAYLEPGGGREFAGAVEAGCGVPGGAVSRVATAVGEPAVAVAEGVLSGDTAGVGEAEPPGVGEAAGVRISLEPGVAVAVGGDGAPTTGAGGVPGLAEGEGAGLRAGDGAAAAGEPAALPGAAQTSGAGRVMTRRLPW
jgi:hypothetical protein